MTNLIKKNINDSLANPNDSTTNQNTDQLDSSSIQDLGTKVATQNSAQVSEAKGLVSSVFGDL